MKNILKVALLGFVLCFTLYGASYAVGYNCIAEQPMTVKETYEKMEFTTVENATKDLIFLGG